MITIRLTIETPDFAPPVRRQVSAHTWHAAVSRAADAVRSVAETIGLSPLALTVTATAD